MRLHAEPTLTGLFPPGVEAGTSAAGGPADQRDGAVRTVAQAADARRAEFEAGRTLAARLLRALGHGPTLIGVGRRGAPEWPAGIVGSIAHARGMCVAAVADAARFAGMGIDVEPDEPIEPELYPAIFSASEMAEPDAPPARLVFSAKEAVFKAQFPLTGAELEFEQVSIRWDRGPGQFGAVLSDAPAAANELAGRLRGGWRVAGGWIVTAAWIDAPGRAGNGGTR
jgi:4'-phosphopantetheinyl transferase EntD